MSVCVCIMDQSPVNSKSKPSTKNVLIDTPYIPIFECRTGPSNMFDYPTPPPRPPKPRSYSGSTTPPAVNRDLKPRRKGSDSDSNSPASPTLKLSPPPSQSHYHVPVSRPQSVKLRYIFSCLLHHNAILHFYLYSFSLILTLFHSFIFISRIDAPPVPCRTRQSANNRDFFNVNNDIVNFSIISRRNLSHDEQVG